MNGLILAGGQSSRMGTDKALLDYQGSPQYLRVKELLTPFCENIFISGKPGEIARYPGINAIADMAEYINIGPIHGVISAFTHDKGPWIVCACDYPLLVPEDIKFLIKHRNTDAVATAYLNAETGEPEPLVAIYESVCKELLMKWLQNGHSSLRIFLKEHNANLLVAKNPSHLVSADTPEMYEKIRSGMYL